MTRCVFVNGDLVTGWGKVFTDLEGVRLDLARMDSLNFDFGVPRRSRTSIALADADLALVPPHSDRTTPSPARPPSRDGGS